MQIRRDLLPKEGDVIAAQYRVESLLGHGGMGAVFAGRHLRTGRAVAIKWMLPQAATSQEALVRFIAEAKATARIEHPNVVHIYDFGDDAGAPFLVMERLRGESLRERLDRDGRLPAALAVRTLIPALRGVIEAHRESIIHRDLKPDNIFLCVGKDGAEREAKVVDFGISKLYDDGGGHNLTGTGMMMGTPSYMSPEQLNAPKDADVRFDVYALGVVLYETITGRCPYDADGIFQLVAQIMSSEPLPPSQLAPDVTPSLEQVILTAMHRNPDERYPDVNALLEALERVAPGLQATGHAPTMAVGGARAPQMTPMTPLHPQTSPLGGANPPQNIPQTMAHPTPTGPQPAANATGPRNYAATAALPQMAPGSMPGVTGPLQQPADGSYPGQAMAGQPQYTPGAMAAGTPYAPYPPEPAKGGAGKWIAAGLVAVLLGVGTAGGAWYLTMGPGTAPDVASDLATSPPEPEVAEAEEPATEPEGDEAEIAAAAAAETPAEAPSVAADPEEAEAPATGRVSIETDGPWAEVREGETSLGRTPLVDHELPVGTHTVGLYFEGRSPPTEHTFEVRSGETTNVSAEAPSRPAVASTRRGRRTPVVAPPQPVIRQVPPIQQPPPRPPPTRPRTERGANGAMIIQ